MTRLRNFLAALYQLADRSVATICIVSAAAIFIGALYVIHGSTTAVWSLSGLTLVAALLLVAGTWWRR